MTEKIPARPNMTSQVHIRPMQIADIAAVREIDQLSFSLPWPANAFNYELEQNQYSLLWVAEATPAAENVSETANAAATGNRQVMGVIVVWLVIDEAHIATIAVHPEYRRQGIARRLLSVALDEVQRREMVSATLEVRASNTAAQKLYKDFGFDIVGLRPRYYRDNNEDALIMTVQLDAHPWVNHNLNVPARESTRNQCNSYGIDRGEIMMSEAGAGNPGNPTEQLKQVASEVSVCKRCVLHHSRKLAVPGEGPVNSEIMFIGEGPGFHENEQGRPFVGAAGKFLDELLESIQMKRSQVFIGNVVKCRPPGNRDPQPDELAACSEYLERQIQAINPKAIVTLGRFSMAHFLPNAKISEIHGQAVKVRGRLIVAMYHPAAALHQRSLKPTIEADFARLPELISAADQTGLKGPAPARTFARETYPPSELPGMDSVSGEQEIEPSPSQIKKEPKQLSLF